MELSINKLLFYEIYISETAKFAGLVCVLSIILASCKKTDSFKNEDLQKVNALNTSSSSSQRYRDMVFGDNQIQVTLNVPYRDVQDYAAGDTVKKKLFYDYFSPVESDPSLLRPLVILLHGGGFTSGGKTQVMRAANRFARYGYCVAALNYRLDPRMNDTANYYTRNNLQVMHNAIYRAVQDAKFAIRKAKGFWRDAKIDTNKIFLGGISASAVIALQSVYLNDQESSPYINQTALGMLDFGGNQSQSSKVAAIFAWAGLVLDLNWITTSEQVPLYQVMSRKDTNFSFLCDIEYGYRRQYACGALEISNRMNALGIVNKLDLLDDLNFTVTPVVPGDFYTLSHGSVFNGVENEDREVDSTVSFLAGNFF